MEKELADSNMENNTVSKKNLAGLVGGIVLFTSFALMGGCYNHGGKGNSSDKGYTQRGSKKSNLWWYSKPKRFNSWKYRSKRKRGLGRNSNASCNFCR